MRIKYGISALALVAALSAPIAAKAALSNDQTAAIKAAVDTAMQSGDTGKLQTLIASAATANQADAGAITDLVAAEINAAQAANPGATLAGSTTTIAEAVTTASITAIVAAAPSQAGTVLAEAQTTLSPDLVVAAVTATQTALAPAAGGNQAQQQIRADVKAIATDLKQVLSLITQIAEIARRSTASPT